VHQAAELLSGLENRARETEARAHSLCQNALERLELAEKRIEIVERERNETINEADGKLRDASSALEQARLRLAAAEDQVRAAEFRAQAAEAKAREAKHALALVEEAIRSRFLSASPEAVTIWNAVIEKPAIGGHFSYYWVISLGAARRPLSPIRAIRGRRPRRGSCWIKHPYPDRAVPCIQ